MSSLLDICAPTWRIDWLRTYSIELRFEIWRFRRRSAIRVAWSASNWTSGSDSISFSWAWTSSSFTISVITSSCDILIDCWIFFAASSRKPLSVMAIDFIATNFWPISLMFSPTVLRSMSSFWAFLARRLPINGIYVSQEVTLAFSPGRRVSWNWAISELVICVSSSFVSDFVLLRTASVTRENSFDASCPNSMMLRELNTSIERPRSRYSSRFEGLSELNAPT